MRHDWSAGRAACVGVDPNVFYVDTKDTKAVNEAKSYCDICPCRAPCLQYAYDTKQEGIWGGTTEREREVAYMLLNAANYRRPTPVVLTDFKLDVSGYQGEPFVSELGKKPNVQLRRLDVRVRLFYSVYTSYQQIHSQPA